MIDLVKQLIDFILHIDRHMAEIIAQYGARAERPLLPLLDAAKTAA